MNFSGKLDTKSDSNQISIGNFLELVNIVRTKTGALTKRNGFDKITTLPTDLQTTLTTLGGNLIATGSNLYAYSQDTDQWINKGVTQGVNLNVKSIVRSSTAQITPSSVVAPNGLALVTYLDAGAAVYVISDTITGEQVVPRTTLPSTATQPKAWILGIYFLVTFLDTVGGVTHLQYVAIPIANPFSPKAVANLASNVHDLGAPYEAIVSNNNLYFAYWSTSGSPDILLNFLTSTLVLGNNPTSVSAYSGGSISVAEDTTQSAPIIWITFWDAGNSGLHARGFNQNLQQVLGSHDLDTSVSINNLTTVATNGVLTAVYELNNTYQGPYPVANIESQYIRTNTLTQTGTVGTHKIVKLSVGLASKAFIDPSGTIYFLTAYGITSSPTLSNQPSYFLMDLSGNIYMRLAYSNGGGFVPNNQISNVSYVNGVYYIPYLITDYLATINGTPNGQGPNKGTNLPSGTPVNSIYTQTGVNLAIFEINSKHQYESEIAGALHLTGGQLWEYDGVRPVEHGFHVWPENIQVTTATTTGSIGAGTYYYQFCYEWTDNAGMLHRSAPSIPFSIVTTGSTSKNTCYVPTLRLTEKVSPNPVRIVGYRWSVAQQVYYQFTSITSPVLNDVTNDYVVIQDTLNDSSILGNTILYTTGGVVEDIAAPPSIDSALYKNRMFLIDAEDQNLLWYSKVVIENVPVEFSDLFTLYIAPTTGAQGSTGPMTAISAMDDKFVIFKNQAIYYLTGNGPDNTGSQNDFSDPIYVTSSVGCTNPNSIVLTPDGLMFQSDKGIWLLNRGLGTTYIGADVEKYNDILVNSAEVIPGTTQVRFILEDGTLLMYDYYYQEWATFTTVSAISSTLYQGYQTYLNSFGQVFQELPGSYVDGSNPVLISFLTGWINAAGIKGFERFYLMQMLTTYFTPYTLQVSLAYDFNPSPLQGITVTPDNYTAPWGGEANWGTGKGWGGIGNTFPFEIDPKKQKCQTFQVGVQEVYDATFGVPPGQGLSFSGMTMIVGIKKAYTPTKGSRTFG